jgi:hypothetical protein
MPENNSEDIGIVIKSISLLMKTWPIKYFLEIEVEKE